MMEQVVSYLNWLSEQPFLDPVLQLITLFILVWTAIEALQSRKENAITNELKLLPLLEVFITTDQTREIFMLKNWGEGAAFDIKITSWKLIFTDSQEIFELRMRLTGKNLLGKDETRKLRAEAINRGNEAIDNDFMLYALRTYKVESKITFKNARGHMYYTIIKTTRDSVNILKPPTRLNLWTKGYFFIRLDVLSNLQLLFYRAIWIFRAPYIKSGNQKIKIEKRKRAK